MRMLGISRIWIWAGFALFFNGLVYSQNDASSKGAFILISTKGEVAYFATEDKAMPAVKVGEIIPATYTIETAAKSELVGLLSNGTLLTLTEKTRMKVATFEQAPFADQGEKLADLPGEPSTSKVTLDLNFGSLVVKTKKLNKESVFNIDSPVGVAGIRGTEFQMASNPGQGVQLDVTESTVAFTPPGGQPIPVSKGNGLSVSPSGVTTPRPVNPVVATKIESTNQSATEATKDVSLGEVVVAVEKASVANEDVSKQEIEPVTSEGESEQEELPEEEAESKSKEDAQSSPNETEQEEVLEPASDTENQEVAPQNEPASDTEPMIDEPDADPGDSQPNNEPAPTPKATEAREDSQVKVQQPDKTLLLENNPELKKNQQLIKFGLSKEQIERYDRLPGEVRTFLLDENPAVVNRLLSMPGFEGIKTGLYIRHDPETRELLLTMSDNVFLTLLDPAVDPVLLKESLKKINLGAIRPDRIPPVNLNRELNSRAVSLGDRLRDGGNAELMEELLQMSGGYLDEYWIRVGEVAEVLSRSLEVSDFSALPGFSAEEVWENPFFPELANIYDQLELDGLVNGADRVLGADNLIVSENAHALGSHFSDGVEEVVLMSRDLMEFRGNFEWHREERPGESRLVLMSADKFSVPEGATLKTATSDLVLATRQDLLLSRVNLEAGKNVTIRGMRDVHLNQVNIRADILATIKARRDINADGLTFNQDISRIVMEAQTMRLRNIDFPGAAQVRLNSLKGAIDGRYPNFGNSIPAAQQIGRVNFIENVRSGGNLMHDRPSFDLHGKNIEIGKIARP